MNQSNQYMIEDPVERLEHYAMKFHETIGNITLVQNDLLRLIEEMPFTAVQVNLTIGHCLNELDRSRELVIRIAEYLHGRQKARSDSQPDR